MQADHFYEEYSLYLINMEKMVGNKESEEKKS